MATPEQRAYARALRDIATRYGRLEADTIRRAVQLLREMRERLQVQLTTAERFDAARLQEMTRAVDDLVAGYESQLLALSNGSLRSAANLGASSVTEPLAAAGLSAGFFQPTPAQLNVLLDFSADLIRNIGRETRQAINTEIRLAALGERSTIDAMKRITDRLGLKAGRQVVGGVAVRGETILRTEMGRVFNVANHSQMEVTAQSVPGLQKQWIATGDGRTRPAHLVAHGQIVAYDEPFKLGRERLMYPLDPNGSAAMTINCRCRMVVVHPEIGPIGGPEDARVEKERDKRAEPVEAAKAVTQQTAGAARGQVRKQALRIDNQIKKLESQNKEIDRQFDDLFERRANIIDRLELLGIDRFDAFDDEQVRAINDRVNELTQRSIDNTNSIRELRKTRLNTLRQVLYVENPAAVNVDFVSKFAADDKRRVAMEEAVGEFNRLVDTDLISGNIKAKAGGRGRSYYMTGKNTMALTTSAGPRVTVHEMGHWLEDVNPDVHTRALNFLDRRTAGDQLIPLSQATGHTGYRSNERTRPDEFIHPYMGKDYGRSATEIVSMGLEYFYAEPDILARDDPDMFDFIFNLLRGQ